MQGRSDGGRREGAGKEWYRGGIEIPLLSVDSQREGF